jgi:hypothetical protein
MKIETNIRVNSSGDRMLYISVKCDECPALLTFPGEKKDIPNQLRFQSWSVGRTGIVRCRRCSQAHCIAVHQAIR